MVFVAFTILPNFADTRFGIEVAIPPTIDLGLDGFATGQLDSRFRSAIVPTPLTLRGAIRLDVLVESQHVAWVVLFLDLHEASIVRPVTRADKLVTRIA
jgi:hypothetical protein